MTGAIAFGRTLGGNVQTVPETEHPEGLIDTPADVVEIVKGQVPAGYGIECLQGGFGIR